MDTFTQLEQEVHDLVFTQEHPDLRENANKDPIIVSTQRDLLAGILCKHYAYKILPKDIMESHDNGEIHYHDLTNSPTQPVFNCMLADVGGMMSEGFRLGNASISTPSSIITAGAIVPQIIAAVASHTYGGTTINRIDEVLAPYAEKSYQKHLRDAEQFGIPDKELYADKLTIRDIGDAAEALEYELNTLTSTNGQTPFITFGFGLGTGHWEREIQKAILTTRIKGLGPNHETAVFPKLVFTLKSDINLTPDTPNYDIKQLAIECASKRIYPDILSYDKVVEVTGGFKAPMGCRSFLGEYENDDGIAEIEGRNNLGVVSINLPRIGIEARQYVEAHGGDVDDVFYAILGDRLQLAKRALFTRIERLRGVKAKVAPILYTEGAVGKRLDPEDEILPLFENGRASISLGYIGVHECLNALYGTDVHPFDSQVLQHKGLDIVKRLSDACKEWKTESGWGFSLYSTPSENLCDRFCRLDQERFGLIKGVTDKGYYTNSFHLDVEYKTNPYYKIAFEECYPAMASGGFINYVELPSMVHNLQGIEDLWDYAYRHVPYCGINMPVDVCYECGFHGEFDCTNKGFSCPVCGNRDPKKVNVIRRVCGYLSSPNSRPFNEGKQEEVSRRRKHEVGISKC